MGVWALCKNKELSLPELLCSIDNNNEQQKSYCIKLRDKFQNEKPIQFRIKHGLQFKISFKLLNGKTYKIQDNFVDSDEILNESLDKMHILLNGGDIFTIFFESTDQRIKYELYCNKDSIFKGVEEKIDKKFAEYRNRQKIYLHDGSMVDINKTFGENKIENNSHIVVAINENTSVNAMPSS